MYHLGKNTIVKHLAILSLWLYCTVGLVVSASVEPDARSRLPRIDTVKYGPSPSVDRMTRYRPAPLSTPEPDIDRPTSSPTRPTTPAITGPYSLLASLMRDKDGEKEREKAQLDAIRLRLRLQRLEKESEKERIRVQEQATEQRRVEERERQRVLKRQLRMEGEQKRAMAQRYEVDEINMDTCPAESAPQRHVPFKFSAPALSRRMTSMKPPTGRDSLVQPRSTSVSGNRRIAPRGSSMSHLAESASARLFHSPGPLPILTRAIESAAADVLEEEDVVCGDF